MTPIWLRRLIGLVVTADGLRWNEWYVATYSDGVAKARTG